MLCQVTLSQVKLSYAKSSVHFVETVCHVLMKHGKPSRRNAQSNPERRRTENEQFAAEGAHFFMKHSKPSRRNAHSQSHRITTKTAFRLRVSAIYDKMSKPSLRNAQKK